MGAYVEDIFHDHGKDWQANLFYSHLLSIPMFAGFAPVLTKQFARLQASQSFQVPPSIATTLPPPFIKLLNSTSQHVVYLTANAITQLLCITGVNILSANTSAVTVTIVLNIRKLVSFMLSLWIFGNQMSALMKFGAAMVFSAGALYGWETSYRIPKKKEANTRKQAKSQWGLGLRRRSCKIQCREYICSVALWRGQRRTASIAAHERWKCPENSRIVNWNGSFTIIILPELLEWLDNGDSLFALQVTRVRVGQG